MNFGFLGTDHSTDRYVLGTKCQQKVVVLGSLEINKVGDEHGSQLLGQWCFRFCDPKKESLPKPQEIKSIFLNIACRLGLKPVIFTDEFKEVLLLENSLCLVADTSALLHGYFEQALRLRGDKPTDIIIPDQVYMEIQRQRERHKNGNSDELCSKLRRLRIFNYIAARSIGRLKKSKILHYVRPPEAMVRYFGAEIDDEKSKGEQSGDDVSEKVSYRRDRLILEALRYQRQTLPHVPIWLVTGDANFAIQVKLEDFNAGYVRQPRLSKEFSFIVTSPFIEPYSFVPNHVPVENFLEECLWEWGSLTFQRIGENKRIILDISDEKISRAILLGIESIEKLISEESAKREFCISKASYANFSLEADYRKVPKRAPTTSNLIKRLETLFRGETINEVSSEEKPYLIALGWVEETKAGITLTSRGKDIINAWSHLIQTDVGAWYDWLLDAREDVNQLDKQASLKKLLSNSISLPETDKGLAEKLGLSERDANSQSILANAFGLAVRLGGKTWKTEEIRPPEAARLILEKAENLRNANISSAVRVDTLFTTLLSATPLSVPTFRMGLLELFENGKIRLGGTSPDSSEEHKVKVRVLIPQRYEDTVDLGVGDFLVPNQSSQVIILLEKKKVL